MTDEIERLLNEQEDRAEREEEAFPALMERPPAGRKKRAGEGNPFPSAALLAEVLPGPLQGLSEAREEEERERGREAENGEAPGLWVAEAGENPEAAEGRRLFPAAAFPATGGRVRAVFPARTAAGTEKAPAGATGRSPAVFPAEGPEEAGLSRWATARWGTAESGTEGAETLYQRLRRTGTAAQYRRPEERAAEPAPMAAGSGWPSLGELDLAFQRDARRYDGGFELF